VALPRRHIGCPDVDAALEGRRLAALLASYALPLEEQQRWRLSPDESNNGRGCESRAGHSSRSWVAED
jgi:hypothetical protein